MVLRAEALVYYFNERSIVALGVLYLISGLIGLGRVTLATVASVFVVGVINFCGARR